MILAATYRPFIDPLDALWTTFPNYWFLLVIPLCLFISMAWKAVRVPDLSTYWRQVFIMTIQALAGLFALWVISLIVILYVMPFWASKGL